MLFEPHDQRMHPAVEQHVRALETHLRAVPRGEILDVHRRGDDRAGDRQSLGDVPFHLRAQHQFGMRRRDRFLDLEMIVGDQRLDAMLGSGGAQVAREFTIVAAQAADHEAQLVAGDARSGDGVRRIAEDEDALAGKVGRIDRAAPPRHPRLGHVERRRGIDPGEPRHLMDEIDRRAMTDRNGLRERLAEVALQPAGGRVGNFGVEDDVEIGLPQAGDVCRARPQRRGDVDLYAERAEYLRHFDDIVAVAKTQCARPKQVRFGTRRTCLARCGAGGIPDRESSDYLVESL